MLDTNIISDLIRTNRTLIEDTLEHTKKMRFGKGEQLPEPVPVRSLVG